MATKLKENLIAFVIAILLAGGVIIAINSSSNLATDILGTKNTNEVSDISLVFTNNSLKLISNKNIPNISSISCELSFNPEKVKINRDNFDSNYQLSTSMQDGENSYTVILQNINNIEKGKSLFEINNITKEQFDNINIGHIQVIDNNGKVLDLTSSK